MTNLAEGGDGYVYAIHAPELKLVRIGWSRKPSRRLLSDLRPSSPARLDLLGVTPGAEVDETHWQTVCADLRVRGHWFREEAVHRLSWL